LNSPKLPTIQSPQNSLGFLPGDPGSIASWEQIRTICDGIANHSDRVSTVEIGNDWSGRSIPAYIVTSVSTQSRLEEYQHLAVSGRGSASKRVVLVTASIHASEIGGSQSVPLLLHQLATEDSIEIQSIRDQLITILVPSMNPSGLELVREWYESTRGTASEGSLPPYPDHPVGHDINRDWVMLTQPETRALHRSIFRRWRPDYHLDLHEMHTTGPRYSLPPFLDPVDPHLKIEIVERAANLGSAVAERMRQDGRHGVVTRTFFDAFAPSRSYVNYHGGVRILAEGAAAKLATSTEVPRTTQTGSQNALVCLSERRLAWIGGTWSFRDLVDYHLIAARSLLELVAGQDSPEAQGETSATSSVSGGGWLMLPYLLQRDQEATHRLLEVLLNGEIELARIDTPIFLNGVSIPAGAFYVRPDQPFIEYANTLLEPTRYPGNELSTPTKIHIPYDVTAHSLPLLMGVDSIRLPVPPLATGAPMLEAVRPVGWMTGRSTSDLFAIPPAGNPAARIINAALERGAFCRRLISDAVIGGHHFQTGSFLIEGIQRQEVEALVRNSGIEAIALDSTEHSPFAPIARVNVGIYRGFVNDFEDSGWTKYVLDEYGFKSRLLDDAAIKYGDFSDLSAIVLPSQKGEAIRFGLTSSDYPEHLHGGIGRRGAENIHTYVNQGGTLISLGSACDAALAILPTSAYNSIAALGPEEFQTPGVLVRLSVDQSHPVCWGFEQSIAAMVTNSPVFTLAREADPSVTRIAHYPEDDPLLAGWIHGQRHLMGRAAMIEIRSGSGRAYLLGCRPQFRGMALGTFSLLFNSIYASAMGKATLGKRNDD